MDEFNEWLMDRARDNTKTVFNKLTGEMETSCFGHPSPFAWINSLTNDDLRQYHQDMENEQ